MYTFLGGPAPMTNTAPQEKQSTTSVDVTSRLEALQLERKNEFSGIKRV
jgi:hypothetical protein